MIGTHKINTFIAATYFVIKKVFSYRTIGFSVVIRVASGARVPIR